MANIDIMSSPEKTIDMSRGIIAIEKMSKVVIGKKMPAMVMPVCIVGANVEGKANFCTIAWMTMIDDEPPTVGLVMAKKRRTKDGIVENGTFSVNLPTAAMSVETDYCGLHSGYDTDKSKMFEVHYGSLGNAPMIVDCPVSAECKLKKVVEFDGTDMVVGEIVEVYVEERCLTGAKTDLRKMDPLIYGSSNAVYFRMGEKVADAFKVGRTLNKKVK